MDNVLSDCQPIEVRRLKFLELEDNVSYLDPGLYIHTYMVEGHPQEVAYGLEDYAEIPERPKIPLTKVQPDSYEAALWEQYHLYRAVLTHEHNRGELREQYLVDCARYILANCLNPADQKRIVTSEDYNSVYRLALCPEVTEEDIIACLATTFQGYVEGQAFMDLAREAKGVGRILFADTALGAAINVSA
jgi:hypothetical protein